MPSSGGSVSDAPVNKVVNGQSHYLAYITPDEGKSLVDQGGQEVVTDSGIPAYPPPGEKGGPGSGSEGREPGGEGRGEYRSPDPQPSSRQPGLETSTSVAKQTALQEDIRSQQTETQEDNLTEEYNLGNITKDQLISGVLKLTGKISSKVSNLVGGAFGIAMTMVGKAQTKAINWDLNKRLQREYKKPTFDPEAEAAGIREPAIELLEDRIRRANLPKDDPDHYSQTDYMTDYPGPRGDLGGDKPIYDQNNRGLVNIITPYAAHAIGGTTPVNSMAAQWYSTLGSSPSNPGAFNLTAQYAAAKNAVSQRLGTPTSVGQLAVNQSPFYNWLKDNSLNKGIL